MTLHDTLILTEWQSRREQGVPPHLRLVEQDNKSEQEWLEESYLVDFHMSQRQEDER